MLPELKQLLEYCEETLDIERIRQRDSLHRSALDWETVERLPLIVSFPYPKNERFQPYPNGQTYDDPEKMLFNQFVSAFDLSPYLSLKLNHDLPITIRADFGCVLIASVFGAKIERQGDNPPWVRQASTSIDYEQIIQNPLLDFERGLIPKVKERYQFYRDVLSQYPRLQSVTHVVLPDLQGPFDNLELLRGSQIFLDLYTEQDKFLEAMSVVCDAQLKLADYFKPFIHETLEGYSHQHGFLVKGNILIRTDTSIMVSPDMYRELISPFEERILQHFGGGIHSCGNLDNIIGSFMEVPSVQCVDFGQSELNDVKRAYRSARNKKIALLRVCADADNLVSGDVIKKFPTGVSLIFRASSYELACSVIEKYH